jgi:predicted enzyme related to lactoylglutathione lyase
MLLSAAKVATTGLGGVVAPNTWQGAGLMQVTRSGHIMTAMITAMHTLVYAEDPDATRAFFQDVLQFPGTDTGGGWLIFQTGPSELGVHPSSWEHEGQSGSTDQQFDVSLMCDDLDKTMAELTAKGARFTGDIRDEGWGITVRLTVPGAGEMTLYQPKYDAPATSR